MVVFVLPNVLGRQIFVLKFQSVLNLQAKFFKDWDWVDPYYDAFQLDALDLDIPLMSSNVWNLDPVIWFCV